jgi:hypothetical protein
MFFIAGLRSLLNIDRKNKVCVFVCVQIGVAACGDVGMGLKLCMCDSIYSYTQQSKAVEINLPPLHTL